MLGEEPFRLLDLSRGHHEAGDIVRAPSGEGRGRGFETLDPIENETMVDGHDDGDTIARQSAAKAIFHGHGAHPFVREVARTIRSCFAPSDRQPRPDNTYETDKAGRS